jgi:hypothetical protein
LFIRSILKRETLDEAKELVKKMGGPTQHPFFKIIQENWKQQFKLLTNYGTIHRKIK